MSFSINNFSLLLAGLIALSAWILLKRQKKAKLYFSSLEGITQATMSDQIRMKIPYVLEYASLGFLLLALANPSVFIEKPHKEGQKRAAQATEGIAIYLVLDKSGSMKEPLLTGKRISSKKRETKLDAMKQVAAQFVAGDSNAGLKGRFSDMIGVVAFARKADVIAPLTLDHKTVLQAISSIKNVDTKEEDGTAIGYAIYKTANMIAATRYFAAEEGIKPSYEIKSAVMVLVTDGFQNPNPLDLGNQFRTMGLEDAAKAAKELGVRLYIVNIEPKLATQEYAPHRRLMERVASLTGGKFYLIDTTKGVSEVFAEIDTLEKSQLPDVPKHLLPAFYTEKSFSPYLIALGLICLFGAEFLFSFMARRVP